MDRTSDTRPLVLLIEDDCDTRDMYGVALALSGFRTAEAATGAGAREAARRLRPDVIVTDLTLPDVDGCDLCAELRRDPATHDVPVIALTGRSGDEDLDCCRDAGCARVLVKPCAPDALAEAISEVLGEATARRD